MSLTCACIVSHGVFGIIQLCASGSGFFVFSAPALLWNVFTFALVGNGGASVEEVICCLAATFPRNQMMGTSEGAKCIWLLHRNSGPRSEACQ